MSAADQREGPSRSSNAARSSDAPSAPRDWSLLALGCGVVSVGWAVAMLLPQLGDLPAWPAASVGVFALVFARAPGRALPRGLGAFLGVLGLLAGIAKILALWGVVKLLGLTVSYM